MDTRQRRPDLERLEVKNPGWITPMIMPLLSKEAQQGTQYYSDIISDEAAQTGRSGGTAPTQYTITDQSTSYNLSDDELIQRREIPDDDIKGLGGLAAAQQKGARKGKRAIGKAIENKTSANILKNGDVTYNDIGTSLIDDIASGYWTVADYAEGTPTIVFVCSSTVFALIKRYDEVKDAMKHTGVVSRDIDDVRNVSAIQLAACLGVDQVIVGPKDSWYSADSDYEDRAALVALPDPAIEPEEEVQVGRTLWFSARGNNPAGENMAEIHSYFSEDELAEMVDARAYAEQKVFNHELIYGFQGIDAGPTS